MGIKLSQPENNLEDVSVVILCAGKGTRLGNLTSDRPKPLLKIFSKTHETILGYTLSQLKRYNLGQIGVIKGYLGDQIEKFVQRMKEKEKILQNKLLTIDAKDYYDKGPLFSFWSITKKNQFYNADHYYLVLPGDTYFESKLLDHLFSSIERISNVLLNAPIVYYRSLTKSQLSKKFIGEDASEEKAISHIKLKGTHNTDLKKILTSKVNSFSEGEKINQLIPIVLFSYETLEYIDEIIKDTAFKSLRDVLNHLIKAGKPIFTIKIPSKYQFYDLDTKADIVTLKSYIQKKEADNSKVV